MGKSRRDFIKSGLVASALAPLAPWMAGCSSLDQWLLGENRDESDKVVILGAGLAGLAAAYHLKKNQMPFRLFEGSSRMGGRVLSIRDLNISSQHGELGAEKIDSDHAVIQNLARELNIRLTEFNLADSAGWIEKNKILSSKEWKQDTAQLLKVFQQIQTETYGPTPQVLSFQNKEQFPKAVVLDRMPASELIERLQIRLKPWMKGFLEQVVRSEWGVEPSQLSALHLLHWMRDSFKPTGKKFFKVKGGSSVLTQALLDRVGGVVPQRFVKFQHQLVEIKSSEEGWRLYFNTPQGRVEIISQKIICTLPPALLRQVRGWEQIPLSTEKRRLLAAQELATHGKVLLSFQSRFWSENSLLGSGGTLFSDFPSTGISEAGDPVGTDIGGVHGVLQAQFGGEVGGQSGPHSVQQMLKDLGRLESKPFPFEDISYVQNWKTFPWSRGSRAYLKPGQFQLFDMASGSESWALAGDAHNLLYLGTMNGAVQSGLEAAARFLKTTA